MLNVSYNIQTRGFRSFTRYVITKVIHNIHNLIACLYFCVEKPGDEELDMLDLAYELTDTSRLGCQIILSKELNGLEVSVPTTINDARS